MGVPVGAGGSKKQAKIDERGTGGISGRELRGKGVMGRETANAGKEGGQFGSENFWAGSDFWNCKFLSFRGLPLGFA